MNYQFTKGITLQHGISIFILAGFEIILGLGVSLYPPLSLALVGSVFFIILALVNYNIALLAFIFTIPFVAGFNKFLTNIYVVGLGQVMLFCMLFLYLIILVRDRKLQLTRSPIDSLYLVFLGWAAVSLFWVPDISIALVHLYILVVMYLFFYATYIWIQSMKSLEYVIWGWWLIGIVLFIVGTMQYMGVVGMHKAFTFSKDLTEGYSRVTGFSGSPSALARVMILTFFTMLGAFEFFTEKHKKLLFGLSLLLSLLVIVLTLSRSAFIALTFGVALYLLRYLRIVSPKYILLALLLVVIFFAFGLTADIDFKVRLASILEFYKDPAWMIRLGVWNAGIDMFTNTYGLGVGAGGVESLFDQYYVSPFQHGTVPPHAHSLYIDLMAHFGVIGAVLMAALLLKLAAYLYRILKKTWNTGFGRMLWAFCCGLTTVFVQLSITGLLHITELWIYMGMITASAKLAQSRTSIEDHVRLDQQASPGYRNS
jgi:O-antigen ligase